ncbi:MAG: MATE family efflux transporter [Alphaproteobacteria bacterium]|jgi:MATE family multidrug resistance protein|nr:MATE family efflux transporter [Alphaproteobacteria bacterium]
MVTTTHSHAPTGGLLRPWRDETRATLRLAWPMIIAQLAQVALQTTDVLMTGRLGPAALAAGALGAQLAIVFTMFGIGILLAVSPLVAQAKGARDPRGVRRSIRQGLWVALALSAVLMAVLSFTGAMLRAVGQNPELAAAADAYVAWAMLGVPGALAFIALRGFIGALSRPMAATVITFFAIPLNAGLNWVLMFGNLGAPALGLVGAGIATAIVQSAMALALIGFVLTDRRMRRYRILGRFWRPDWQRFRDIVVLGLPIGLALIAEVGAFTASTWIMGWISEIHVAAHAIALQIITVAFMIPLGLGMATTVRVGLAHGAGDPAAVRRAGLVGLGVGAAIMSISALILLTVPAGIVGLFLNPEASPRDARVYDLAVGFLFVAAVFQLADGTQVIAAHALRGLSDTRYAFVAAAIGFWPIGFGLALLLAFPLGLDGLGVWWGLALGLTVVAVALTRRFLKRTAPG